MSDSIRAIVANLTATYRSIKACIPPLVTSATSVPLSGTAKVDYRNCDCTKALEESCDRLSRLLDTKVITLMDWQLHHCVQLLRHVILTSLELLCVSSQLEDHVRYAFTVLCSLLDISRDKVNVLILRVYEEECDGVLLHQEELLNIVTSKRCEVITGCVSDDLTVLEHIVSMETSLLRTVCAAVMSLLPPTPWGGSMSLLHPGSWGGNVTNYVLREGLDPADNVNWTNFLMPGINSPGLRQCVAMTTSNIWRKVSQRLVTMDHMSCGGVSATGCCDVAASEALEPHPSLFLSLLYIANQIERHKCEHEQDTATSAILSSLVTEKCHDCHGNTASAHMIVDNLLQPTCATLKAWLSQTPHITANENCQKANVLQVSTHVLRGVARILLECNQWYHSRLHQHFSNWGLSPLLLLLLGDLPHLLRVLQEELLPISTQLLDHVTTEQLSGLQDDVRMEHDKIVEVMALIKEQLFGFMRQFYDGIVERCQQFWRQPIKLSTGNSEGTPTRIAELCVEQLLSPCVQACAILLPSLGEPCVTLCVTVTIVCWRNSVLATSKRYSVYCTKHTTDVSTAVGLQLHGFIIDN
ncbi:uncharacterized protein [Dysidea avara]|uniref:uncharacterized protein isoform X3 n=1 Tax=Dysidea avara TaxID=196820 RepID=UPI00332EAA50